MRLHRGPQRLVQPGIEAATRGDAEPRTTRPGGPFRQQGEGRGIVVLPLGVLFRATYFRDENLNQIRLQFGFSRLQVRLNRHKPRIADGHVKHSSHSPALVAAENLLKLLRERS